MYAFIRNIDNSFFLHFSKIHNARLNFIIMIHGSLIHPDVLCPSNTPVLHPNIKHWLDPQRFARMPMTVGHNRSSERGARRLRSRLVETPYTLNEK